LVGSKLICKPDRTYWISSVLNRFFKEYKKLNKELSDGRRLTLELDRTHWVGLVLDLKLNRVGHRSQKLRISIVRVGPRVKGWTGPTWTMFTPNKGHSQIIDLVYIIVSDIYITFSKIPLVDVDLGNFESIINRRKMSNE